MANFSPEEYVNQITDSQIEIIKNKGYFLPNTCVCNNCYHSSFFIEEIDPLCINGTSVVICRNCGHYVPIKPYDDANIFDSNGIENMAPGFINQAITIDEDEITKQDIKQKILTYLQSLGDTDISRSISKIFIGLPGQAQVPIIDPRMEYDAFGQRKIGVYAPSYEEYFNLKRLKEDTVFFLFNNINNNYNIFIYNYKNYTINISISFEDEQLKATITGSEPNMNSIIQSQVLNMIYSISNVITKWYAGSLSFDFIPTYEDLLAMEKEYKTSPSYSEILVSFKAADDTFDIRINNYKNYVNVQSAVSRQADAETGAYTYIIAGVVSNPELGPNLLDDPQDVEFIQVALNSIPYDFWNIIFDHPDGIETQQYTLDELLTWKGGGQE